MRKREKRRPDSKQFSVSFPSALVEEIDIICKVGYMSRSSWLIAAAKEKLERERLEKITKLKQEVK